MAEASGTSHAVELAAAVPGLSRWNGIRVAARTTVRSVAKSPLTRLGVALTVAFALFAIASPYLVGDPLAIGGDILQQPSWAHPFGTDHLGRDLLARVADGSRISLLVAIVSVAFGLALALPLGMTAGYFGGTWIDEVIMRGADVILSLPLYVLAMVFLGLTGTGSWQIGPLQVTAAWKVIILIAIAALPLFARVARSATLVEKHEGYVDAQRVIGVPRRQIILREILVNVLPPVLTQAFLWMAIAVFAEAALSFLGLGVQPPDPTLGNLLFEARDYLLQGAWWYSLCPGAVLVLAITGFNLLGDGLSDITDRQSS